MPLAAKKLA